MNRKKLKCIDDYIFAKTINLMAKNTNVSRENAENFNLINTVKKQSDNLLIILNKKISSLKLNNISFLVLKKELEDEKLYLDSNKNLNKIKEMLPKLNKILEST